MEHQQPHQLEQEDNAGQGYLTIPEIQEKEQNSRPQHINTRTRVKAQRGRTAMKHKGEKSEQSEIVKSHTKEKQNRMKNGTDLHQ